MNVIRQLPKLRLLGLVMCLAAGMFLTSATASEQASGTNAVTAWNANAGDAAIAACFIGGYWASGSTYVRDHARGDS